MLKIEEKFVEQLVQYLNTRPYAEVKSAVPILQNLQPIEEDKEAKEEKKK